MKSKVIPGVALVMCLAAGCSTTDRPEFAKADGLQWGEAIEGFQMAAWLDESNGIVHCRIRNATTKKTDYPSFDFGYFENIRLEIQDAAGWTNLESEVFPQAPGYSSAGPNLHERIGPGQIVTDTYVRALGRDESRALHVGSLNQRYDVRAPMVVKSCAKDTFALDLIWINTLPKFPEGQSVKARVIQRFRTDEDMWVSLCSPVFTIKGSLLQTYAKRSRELN